MRTVDRVSRRASSRHWTRAESSRMTRSSLTTLERFACRIAATWGSPARATRAHDHSAPCMWLKRLVWSSPLSWPSGVPETQRHAGLCALLRCEGRCPALAGRKDIPVDPPCAGGFKAGRGLGPALMAVAQRECNRRPLARGEEALRAALECAGHA